MSKKIVVWPTRSAAHLCSIPARKSLRAGKKEGRPASRSASTSRAEGVTCDNHARGGHSNGSTFVF